MPSAEGGITGRAAAGAEMEVAFGATGTRMGPGAGFGFGAAAGEAAPGLTTGAGFAGGADCVSVLDKILLNNPSMFCLSSFSLALRRAC
jgi:hypothetical protein